MLVKDVTRVAKLHGCLRISVGTHEEPICEARKRLLPEKIELVTAIASGAPTSDGPKDEQGYLTIICKPYCDNVKRGGTSLGKSPVVKSATAPGKYVITLSRAGEPDRTVSATVVAGQTEVIRVNMK